MFLSDAAEVSSMVLFHLIAVSSSDHPMGNQVVETVGVHGHVHALVASLVSLVNLPQRSESLKPYFASGRLKIPAGPACFVPETLLLECLDCYACTADLDAYHHYRPTDRIYQFEVGFAASIIDDGIGSHVHVGERVLVVSSHGSVHRCL